MLHCFFLGVLGLIIWPAYLMLICPCNLEPLTPHFYIVKRGLRGLYILCLFMLLNNDCGGSNVYPHSIL